eukprot:scaffold5911_cov127-Isochrysis_galbana.AAC.5
MRYALASGGCILLTLGLWIAFLSSLATPPSLPSRALPRPARRQHLESPVPCPPRNLARPWAEDVRPARPTAAPPHRKSGTIRGVAARRCPSPRRPPPRARRRQFAPRPRHGSARDRLVSAGRTL